MKKNIILAVCLLGLCACEVSQAPYSKSTYEDRRNISSLNLLNNEDLILMNEYLKGKSILNYFKIRQKLLSFSYDVLSTIKQHASNVKKISKLRKLIDKILFKMEDESIFHLVEETFINNVPSNQFSPFYDNADYTITSLKPASERLYFDNLKLQYRNNNLIAKTGRCWINSAYNNKSDESSGLYKLPQNIRHLQVDGLFKDVRMMWNYELKDDNLSNFILISTEKRQRIKKYEENLILPFINKEGVFLRNEYRLFCIDAFSGKELWSFAPDNNGHELYQTMRHPHHNSYGYEMFVGNNIVCTELAGKLVVIKIEDKHRPKLLWERNLGEYTVCVKPVLYEDIFVVSLINSKGELWVCGFNFCDGTIEWSSYVGITSFLSPACEIYEIDKNKIILGTNNGVLICLEPKSGDIIWIRTYMPKKYSIFNYFLRREFEENWLNKGSIVFDTQFLEVGDNEIAYFKPRESDYLYLINIMNGEIIEELLIDSDKYYLLKASREKIVLFDKMKKGEMAQVKVFDLKTGNQIFTKSLKGGFLRGVIHINRGDILFKVDNMIYALGIRDDHIQYSETAFPIEGWLLNATNRFLFVGHDRTVYCLYNYSDLDSYTEPHRPNMIRLAKERSTHHESIITDRIRHREMIKNKLTKAIISDVNSGTKAQMIDDLLSDIKSSSFPLDDLFSYLVDNLEKLKHPEWDSFFVRLQKLYENGIITYNHIEMQFSNFLYENGLIKKPHTLNEEHFFKSDNSVSDHRDFQVKGERIRLIPIQVVNGTDHLNLFIILNFDQLLCVAEDGQILWSRKCFQVHSYMFLFPERKIEAYLYNNVLIINDRINIVAVNIYTGHYLWSMTNKGIRNKSEFFKPVFNPKRNDIEFLLGFNENKIIIVHGGKVYSVKPMTGFCEFSNELNISSAFEMAIQAKHIYILSRELENIQVLNEQLNVIEKFTLDFIENKKGSSDLLITSNYIFLSASPYVYQLNKRNGTLVERINIGDFDECYMEYHNNSLLAIIPFRRLFNFSINNNSFSLNWELNMEYDGLTNYLQKRFKGRHYFIVDNTILMPVRKEGGLFIESINIESGEEIWKTHINDVKGIFICISNCERIDNALYFIISSGMEEFTIDDINYITKGSKENNDPFSYNIFSRLFKLDISTGELMMIKQSPPMVSYGFQRNAIVHTKNFLMWLFNSHLLETRTL